MFCKGTAFFARVQVLGQEIYLKLRKSAIFYELLSILPAK